MTLVLAPYNDSMRLGQGFNSYTHELCIDNAVTYKQTGLRSAKSPAQTVSYSSRHISKLSDVMDSLNISLSNAIKRGTVEISGNANAVDETTLKQSDVTFMLSVKVTNQTTILDEDVEFQAMNDLIPGTSHFNDIYGDCYISGFIEGGDLTGLVSVRSLDRTRTSKKISEIKNALSSKGKDELVLDSFVGAGTSSAAAALQDTETTVSVSWMGGGQIKEESTLWDIDSLYAAAAAFPARVAECPQRTWAILTKYKANRKFIQQYKDIPLERTLQYDQISTFTAELFDNFMDYKLLFGEVQKIIKKRDEYEAKLVVNAIDTTLPTLLSVKSALREEQSKIIQAINILARDPSVLEKQEGQVHLRESPAVTRILESALGKQRNTSAVRSSASKAPTSDQSNNGSTTSDASDEVVVVSKDNAIKQSQETKPALTFDFNSLVPPEVWGDLMPEPKKASLNSPLQQIGLGSSLSSDGSTSAIPNVVISQGYDAMRRELDVEKAAAKTAIASADQAREDALIAERKLAELKEEYSKEKERADASRRDLSQTIANERDATAAAKANADQQVAKLKEELQELQKLQTVQKDFETMKVKLESTKQERNASNQKVMALESELDRVVRHPWYTGGRVQIYLVVYGGKPCDNDADLGSRLINYAHTKEGFRLSGGADPWEVFRGRDPLPGVVKSGAIVYRYDDGPLRLLAGTQSDSVRFDDY